MQTRFGYATLLLLTSQLVAPAVLAQTAPAAGGAAPAPAAPPPASTTPTGPTSTPVDTSAPQAAGAQAEVSTPGYDPNGGEDIVVVGRNIPNFVRATPQVVSILSTEDIARTGEGDIAGALSRVTGLSIVGNGFVYVRGLGDRYSSSLLNGSPLPSPEPLRRSVPLDIFPTTIVGSRRPIR
jgi:outer membrane receptor protein involved in Fe transport